MRVVHYLNQFFAGRGGEEAAGHPPSSEAGPIGPGKLLDQKLGDDGTVVATVVCGDNYVSEHGDEAIEQILELIGGFEPDFVVAGPAFNAGRYGVACALVASGAARRGIASVTGMHPENPGLASADKHTYTVPTTLNAVGMGDTLDGMIRLGRKLVAGEELGSAADEGYLPRGIRRNMFADRTGAERAIEQLLRKIAGEPFETEIPLPTYDRVPPSVLSDDLSGLTIALVTEASVVPRGNPDRLESARGTHWFTYDIKDLDGLDGDAYETVHGGFDNAMVNEDPDRVLPLDVMRELEREGVFAKLHDSYYVTTGMATAIAESDRIGREIAEHVRSQGIHAVLVTST